MQRPTRQELIELVQRYQQQKTSPEETAFIERYYAYFDKQDKLSAGLSSKEKRVIEKKLFQNIESRIGTLTEMPGAAGNRHLKIFSLPVRKTLQRVAAAAILILCLGGVSYLLLNNRSNKKTDTIADIAQRFKNDVAPGSNRAILTLADGRRVNLDSAHNGILSQQGSSKVMKFQAGMLAYHASTQVPAPSVSVLYNTVTTPRGGQYHVLLSDGTQVWLNAASSLRFPTSFTGNERTVELTGEAYFEVAHASSPATGNRIPFSVKVNNMQVEVLGTHFNINAYDDESLVKTTLLEGSVKVSHANNSVLLKPGEQAQFSREGAINIIPGADVDEAVAWKNGMFEFKSADIRSIMRQVERWYDVDVDFQKNVEEKFYAEISRNTNVSNVFKILETTGAVHFRIDGRKVSVMP